jgi:hypothetical protein
MADAGGDGPIKRGVALTKDIFSLLRDAVVFVGLVLLLIFPRFINQTLSNAGITEIDNGIIKWQSQLAKTTDQLKVANDTIANLQAKTQNLDAQTTPAVLTSATPEQKQAIEAARQQVQIAATAAAQVQQNNQTTIHASSVLLSQAATASSAASAATPASGYCYQEMDPRKPDSQRYAVLCHATKANCDTARGPNPRTVQSACVAVNLGLANWSPRSGGYLGSWYQYDDTPFSSPFPSLPGR